MTPISQNELPVLFATSGLARGNRRLVSGSRSVNHENILSNVSRGTDPARNISSIPEIERELVQFQQRVEKGQVLGKKDLQRFRASLRNQPLQQVDIDFLTNQYTIAAAYSAETPKPKIAAAMFHLRTIQARLRNLMAYPVSRGDCQKRMWYEARHSTCQAD